MNTSSSSTEIEGRMTKARVRNPRFMRTIQVLSWVVTLIFIIALVGAIYQAVVSGNPLPVWAWIGMVALLAMAVGLVVMVVVYRGVVKEVGPFDFSPSNTLHGELKRETRQVEAKGASSLRANIKMMAGILQLAAGAREVMEADFTYDDADWKQPAVDYGVDQAGQGDLLVEQEATGRVAMRQGRSEWSIRLNQDLPIDLNVKFGAGKANLKLAGLDLTHLHVESGVGELVLDLSGTWRHDLEATINAGIGDTTLRLPQEAGLRVQSTVGLGSVHPRGLKREGDVYTNDLYGQAPVNLDIIIEGGMGKVTLDLAD
jgi:hypothetical protein